MCIICPVWSCKKDISKMCKGWSYRVYTLKLDKDLTHLFSISFDGEEIYNIVLDKVPTMEEGESMFNEIKTDFIQKERNEKLELLLENKKDKRYE